MPPWHDATCFRSSSGTGWLVALGLLVGFGIMSTYTMLSYAALFKATNTKSIGEIWKKLINHRTEWVVDLSTLALYWRYICITFYRYWLKRFTFRTLVCTIINLGWYIATTLFAGRPFSSSVFVVYGLYRDYIHSMFSFYSTMG